MLIIIRNIDNGKYISGNTVLTARKLNTDRNARLRSIINMNISPNTISQMTLVIQAIFVNRNHGLYAGPARRV